MPMPFDLSIETLENAVIKFTFTGSFDENSQFPSLDQYKNSSELIVDLKMVSFINSSGVKNWVNFVSEIDKLDFKAIQFVHCPKIFIEQVNMIEGYLPTGAKVKSLFVPIYCNKCDQVFNSLVDTEKMPDPYEELIYRANNIDCKEYPKCRNKLELDVAPEFYFNFLNK